MHNFYLPNKSFDLYKFFDKYIHNYKQILLVKLYFIFIIIYYKLSLLIYR